MFANAFFMMGCLFTCMLVLICIIFIYYPQKRLFSSASKAFSLLLVFLFFTLLFDSFSYAIEFFRSLRTYSWACIIMWGFTICTLVDLNGMANYCYLMTFARKRKISSPFILLTSLPSVIALFIFIIMHSRNDFFTFDDDFLGFNPKILNVIVSLYLIYGLIMFLCVVSYRKEQIIKAGIVIDLLVIVQLAIMVYIAKKYYVLTDSIFITLDILVLFITVQSPKNCVDSEFGCFDNKALDLILEDLDMSQRNYYLFTIEIVNIKYYQAKYGAEFVTKLQSKLYSLMPKDSQKLTTYRHSTNTFVSITRDFNQYQKMLEYIKDHLSETWYIDGSKFEVLFQISHYYKDYKSDDENSFIFLDRIISHLRRDSKKQLLCINETKELMNREVLVQNAIKAAINKETFQIYIQPIFNLNTRKFDKGEVLIRLIDPILGFIPPDEFIPMAERMNFTKDITHQLIAKTLQYLSQTDIMDHGITNLNINLSTIDLTNNGIDIYLTDMLRKFSLSPSNITLEVTETAETESETLISTCIRNFHEEGFFIALDDYGTGYSNIERILSMPFDFIKIDKNLLTLSTHSHINEILLRKNIEMLKECGYKIVVEGVEKDSQVEFLGKLGVDYIQGYFYARPMPLNDFTSFIKEHNQGQH